MIRSMSGMMMAALCATIGCSRSPAAIADAPPEAFAGTWRSVTPSLEFIRLSVVSLSREMGVFGAQLTFSGTKWDGSGRIAGDSLVAAMSYTGTSTSSGDLVLRAIDAQTLRVRVRPAAVSSAPQMELTLVREN